PCVALHTSHAYHHTRYVVPCTRDYTHSEYQSSRASLPQVVIADYTLPQFSALRALDILRRARPEIPFILVTGTIGEEKAAEAIRLGADDYMLKDRLARLPSAVEKAVRGAEERAANKKATAEIEAGLRRAQVMAKLAHVVTGPGGAFERWSETLPPLAGMEADRLPHATPAGPQLVRPRDRAPLRAQALDAGLPRPRPDGDH